VGKTLSFSKPELRFSISGIMSENYETISMLSLSACEQASQTPEETG